MSIRNILVAFNGSDGAVNALKYAAALAGDGAHVTALLAHSTHETVSGQAPWVPARAREIIAQANADILDQVEARFADQARTLGLGDRLTFQRLAGRVDAVLSETARNYDLLIIGQDRGEGVDEHVTLHPDRIALLSGRPVLIVPAGQAATACHSHAAVAWDGSRAAARALSDSLDLLQAQSRVTLLTVGEAGTPRPVQETLTHLSLHGVDAAHTQVAAVPGIARALLAWCEAQSPCLLVMGAYEHSKFREDFLGGVTARVLRDVNIPVLLSH